MPLQEASGLGNLTMHNMDAVAVNNMAVATASVNNMASVATRVLFSEKRKWFKREKPIIHANSVTFDFGKKLCNSFKIQPRSAQN